MWLPRERLLSVMFRGKIRVEGVCEQEGEGITGLDLKKRTEKFHNVEVHNFHISTVQHLDIINVLFIHQLMHQ